MKKLAVYQRLRFFRAALLVASWVVTSTTGSTTFAQLPTGTWQYLWGDEFTEDSLDSKKWNVNYPWGPTHNHDAYMSPDNIILGDGTLTLRAERVAQGGKPFTSAAVTTGYDKFRLNGGYIEARIRLPDTPGSWPAFWGLYTGWPPEADIMEYPIDTAAGTGYAQDQYHTAFHYRNTSGGNSAGAGQVNPSGVGDLGGTYHNFGMQWIEDDRVGFYFNGNLVTQITDNAAIAQMQDMYLILNYAVGGWPGRPNTTEWPVNHFDDMKVDWVRVWKNETARVSNWSYSGANEYVQWDTTANWSNGAPNLGGVTANFNTVANVAEQRLDWSGIRTISNINLNGSTRYRIGFADDRLIFAGSNNATVGPTLTVASTSTIDHEVRAETELFNTLAINNSSAQSLTMTGRILGAGGITVDGAGLVIFNNSNTYVGNTTIDSGDAGSAVARATSSNAFGTVGAVTIGQSGNQTTARLELQGDITLTNTLNFSGRNNTSVGIRNVSGNNTLAGMLQARIGGGNYVLESQAGTLNLTGQGPNANGIALSTDATGTRTFTLQGNGNGIVSGRIVNGSGTVAIQKSGAGTWLLSGSNTFTGGTTVNAGTLELASTQAIAAGSLSINNAVVKIADTLTATAVDIGTLSFTGNGKLDLNRGGAVLNGTNTAAVRSRIISGRSNGTWNGPRISSSHANANSQFAVGYRTGGATFMGVASSTNDVLLRTVQVGDLDLDGNVDSTDRTTFIANFGTAGSGDWFEGDLNYDGNVNVVDRSLLSANFGQAPVARFLELANAASNSGPTFNYNSATGEVTVTTNGAILSSILIDSAAANFLTMVSDPDGVLGPAWNQPVYSGGMNWSISSFDTSANLAQGTWTLGFMASGLSEGDFMSTLGGNIFYADNSGSSNVTNMLIQTTAIPEPTSLAFVCLAGAYLFKKRQRWLQRCKVG